MSVENISRMFHLVSGSYFEISRNMVPCPTDGRFYHSYDLSIYCHYGFLYKPAYKVGQFKYLFILSMLQVTTKYRYGKYKLRI